MFSAVLIANRGEIACRIIRAARKLGLRAIAVYSDADVDSPHARLADVAIRIGPAAARESYLDGAAIIAAARAAGADCVHPGYGFLSENADFAQACADAGLTFIGPPPSAIRAMGLKDRARALMQAAGVPVTPGYHGDEQDPDALARAAAKLGYPVMIKAAAGGGSTPPPISPTPWRAPVARRQAPSAMTASSSNPSSRIRVTSRCRYSPTPMAAWCICSSAIARCSVDIRR